MDAELCRGCERRNECREPCKRLRVALGPLDRGRQNCKIKKRKSEEISFLLENYLQLDPTTDAIVHLYYQCNFRLERIGPAFHLSASSVSRRIKTAWRKIAKNCKKPALYGDT